MKKRELLDSAKNLEENAMGLLERASALRTNIDSALQAAKRLESQLQSKEREAELQLEREQQEAELKRELAETQAQEEREKAAKAEETAKAEAAEKAAKAEKAAREEREAAERRILEEQQKAAEQEKKNRPEKQSQTAAAGDGETDKADKNKEQNETTAEKAEIEPTKEPAKELHNMESSDKITQNTAARNEKKSSASEAKKAEESSVRGAENTARPSKNRYDNSDSRSKPREGRFRTDGGRNGEGRQNAGNEGRQYSSHSSYENGKGAEYQSDRRRTSDRNDTRPSRSRTNSDIRGRDKDSLPGNSRPQSSRYQQHKSDSAMGGRENRSQENRGTYIRTFDVEKKGKNKKTIMKETAPSSRNWDEENRHYGSRRKKNVKAAEQHKPEPVVIDKAVITTEFITVREFSEKIGKPAAEIIKKLFMMDIVANINQEIDFDTCQLVAMDYNIELEQQLVKSAEETMQESAEEADSEEELEPRPPVVTIMGHVDHGKTSLLDAIRNSSVTSGEAGGITQHIGAYTVTCKGRTITFIDTPGHEAFTAMRARGAQVTDVVILVVAADDGIMPQTVEAINHSKAANVPIIVAINKIDKPTADPERVKKQLTEYGLVCEEWGGDVICVPISAKKQINLDSLLEMVLLQADVLELRANPNRAAKGTIVESKLDKGRGPVATVLVQNGTLRVGDPIVAGLVYGKVRAMTDDRGRSVKEAGPSQPVEVLGFNEVPEAGDILNVAEFSKKVAEERKSKMKVEQMKTLSKANLDDLFGDIQEGNIKTLNLIVKADVHGSVEAVTQALEKLSNDEVQVKCIHGGVGGINESDVMFASASNAVIIGFNVRPNSSARALAEQEKVDIRTYRVIYQAIEEVENAMKGMFKPVYREVQLGTISVRNVFKISGAGTIAGCYVTEGKTERNSLVRVVRDGIVIHEGKIASLRRFKDDVKEVAAGYECGIGIENFNDIHEGDVIESYVMEEVKR